MNPVVISVCIMLVLALMRVNVVVALTFSAIIGGVASGMSLNDAVAAFESGLGGGPGATGVPEVIPEEPGY